MEITLSVFHLWHKQQVHTHKKYLVTITSTRNTWLIWVFHSFYGFLSSFFADFIMKTFYRSLAILTWCLVLATAISASNSRPPRNNLDSYDGAVKYFEDVINQYGNSARSRYGKRSGLNLLEDLRNKLIEQNEMNNWNGLPYQQHESWI